MKRQTLAIVAGAAMLSAAAGSLEAQVRTMGKQSRDQVAAGNALNDRRDSPQALATFDSLVDKCTTKDGELV